jgi:hypothetical protein
MMYVFEVRPSINDKTEVEIEASTTDEAWGRFNNTYSDVFDEVKLLNGYHGKHMKVLRYGKEEK